MITVEFYEWTSVYSMQTTIYGYHQRIWGCFGHRSERPFIFRVSDDKPGHVLVRSSDLPTGVEVKKQKVEFFIGQELIFDIRANPTKAEKQKNGRSKRIGLREPQDVQKWWKRKGDLHGFRSIIRHIDDNGFVRWVGRGGRYCTANRIDISGSLVVTNPSAFADVFVGGIGKAKAFGFGMLLLERHER